MDSFLSSSSADADIQEDDEQWNWESSFEEAPMDDSLSSFYRLSSSAEPKASRNSEKTKGRRELLRNEFDAQPDIQQ